MLLLIVESRKSKVGSDSIGHKRHMRRRWRQVVSVQRAEFSIKVVSDQLSDCGEWLVERSPRFYP